MEAKNAAFSKQVSRRRVLSLLQQQPLSRAELARQMGLTRAAISLITEELIKDGLIRESKQPMPTTGPGRTPTALRLCEGACYAVGISLGRRHIRIGIEDLCGSVITSCQVADHSLTGLIRAVEAMLAQEQLPKEKLLGIGISAPGPVDTQTGTILNPPDFPGWSHCPVCTHLEEAFGLPCYLENDANAAALFNRRYCDFPEKDDFLLLYMGFGVGSGVISQGRLLRSCELGHCSIDFNGPLCSCGNRGCLELYASVNRLLERFPQYKTWEQLLSSPHRIEALSLEADYLAAAIINISNMLSIGAVLFDGLLQQCCDELLPMIRTRIKNRTLSGMPVRLLPALQREHCSIQSACSIVFSRCLDAE